MALGLKNRLSVAVRVRSRFMGVAWAANPAPVEEADVQIEPYKAQPAAGEEGNLVIRFHEGGGDCRDEQ